jgi:hypothetical protein
MTPVRQFYELHFLGNYDDWKAAPLDKRRAMNLALSANQLADWVLADRMAQAPHLVSAWKTPRAFRDWLTSRCPDFGLVWDVADGHKHMRLTKPERDKPVQEFAGAFDVGAFDQSAFDTNHLAIVLHDGTARRLPVVFRSVSEMWARLLKEWAM